MLSVSKCIDSLFCPVMACILLIQVPNEAASSSAASIFGGTFNSTNYQTCLSVASLREIPMCSNDIEALW